MMRNAGEYKKMITGLMLSVIICFPVVDYVQNRQAEAQFADVINSVLQPLQLVAEEALKIFTTKDGIAKNVGTKIAVTIAKSFIDKNLKSVVSWIYTGFDQKQKPKFVQNLPLTLESVKKSSLYNDLKEYSLTTDSYNAKKVILGVLATYTKLDLNPNTKKINTYIKTYVTEKNTWKTYLEGSGYGNDDSSLAARKKNAQNFWSKWTVANNPEKALLGEYIKLSETIAKNGQAKQAELEAELAQNNGFMGNKECLKSFSKTFPKKNPYAPANGTPIETVIPPEDISSGIQAVFFDILKLNTAQAQITTPAPIASPKLPTIKLPTINEKINQSNIDPGSYTAPKYNPDDCAVYATTLPGAIIEHMLGKATDTPLDQANQVDTWQELLSYSVTSLTDQLVKQGTQSAALWGKKKINEQLVGISNKFSDFDIKALLEKAPEAITEEDVYESGVGVMADLIGKATPELTECLKSLGINAAADVILQNDIDNSVANNVSSTSDAKIIPQELTNLAQASGTCDFSKTQKVEAQLTQIKLTQDIQKESIPYVRKLDICIPGPDKGWESRFAGAYTRSRGKLNARLFKAKKETEVENTEQYSSLLDLGYAELQSDIHSKTINPDSRFKLKNQFTYKSLVSRSEDIFANELFNKEMINNYTRVIGRLKDIEEMWKNGIDETGAPLTAERRLALLQEINSFTEYTNFDTTNKETEKTLTSAIVYLRDLKEAIKKCDSERKDSDILGPGGSKHITGLYSSIVTKSPIFDGAYKQGGIVKSIKDLVDGAQEYSAKVFKEPDGADAVVNIKDLLDPLKITRKDVLIDGSKLNLVVGGTSIPIPTVCYNLGENPPPEQVATCEEEIKKSLDNKQGTTPSSVTGGGQYKQENFIDDKALREAIKDGNKIAFKNYEQELKDGEIYYYCASSYAYSSETMLVLGIVWDGFDNSEQRKAARSGLLAPFRIILSGGVLLVPELLSATTLLTAEKNPSTTYSGFSCQKFYYSRSVNDYDPSYIKIY